MIFLLCVFHVPQAASECFSIRGGGSKRSWFPSPNSCREESEVVLGSGKRRAGETGPGTTERLLPVVLECWKLLICVKDSEKVLLRCDQQRGLMRALCPSSVSPNRGRKRCRCCLRKPKIATHCCWI